jgi:hypothetical protein
LANIIGASLFFWLDRYIFKPKFDVVWDVNECVECTDCGEIARGYRLVKNGSRYDKSNDECPEYRCEGCSARKYNELKEKGRIK